MKFRPLVLHTLLVLAACPVFAVGDEPISFRRDIAPILQHRCVACHRHDRAEGSFRADSYQALRGAGESGLVGITPHDADESEVLRRIESEDESERMPLEHTPLAPDHVKRFRDWIAGGAEYDGDDPTSPLVKILPHIVHPDPPEAYPQPWPITAVATADGGTILAGGYHEVTQWDPSSGRLVARITNLPERITALARAPDGQQLAVAGGQPGRMGDVRIVDPATSHVDRALLQVPGVVLDVAWSPNGDRLAASTATGFVYVIAIPSGEIQVAVQPHSDWAYSARWDPAGDRLVTASRDGTVKVLEGATGDTLTNYQGHEGPVRGAVFDPAGTHVYSMAAGSMRKWKAEDGGDDKQVVELEGDVTAVAAGGKRLLVATDAKKIYRIEFAEESVVGPPLDVPGRPLSIAWAEDESGFVVGYFDGRVRMAADDSTGSETGLLAAPGLP